MNKKIVFCADGTWNGPEEQTSQSITEGNDTAGELGDGACTNVYKLYLNLAGAVTPETATLRNEQEKSLIDAMGNTLQVVKYLHGVGDSSNNVTRVLGGVFGVGMVSRIVRGYTFISRHYQPGDAIYITGFSRGAYTARSLAGMIARVGLMDTSKYDVNDKETAYRRGLAAWYRSKGVTLNGSGVFIKAANHVLDFFEGLLSRPTLKTADLIGDVPMKAVAVWDTVGSLGVPLYLRDKRLDVFQFTDTKLNDRVEYGFHAMAIDELRTDFPVTRWDSRKQVEQAWFVGAHADVGGGYDHGESRLSDVALQWMMQKLAGVGVSLLAPMAYVPDCACSVQAIHQPWSNSPFNLLAKSPRQPLATDLFHASVIDRWKSDLHYRPQALAFITAQNIATLLQV